MITKIHFLIQLVVVKTIHHSQGLLLNELVFDPTYIKKNMGQHIQHYLAFE
jgi:hypothetical protein